MEEMVVIRRKQFNPGPLQSYPPSFICTSILCPIYKHGSMWMCQGRIIYRVSWCSVIAWEKSWYKNYWSWCSCSRNIESASERGGILLPAFSLRLVSRRGETRPGLLYSSSRYTSISLLALLQNRNGKIYKHPRNYETNCIKIAGHVTIKIYKQKTTKILSTWNMGKGSISSLAWFELYLELCWEVSRRNIRFSSNTRFSVQQFWSDIK